MICPHRAFAEAHPGGRLRRAGAVAVDKKCSGQNNAPEVHDWRGIVENGRVFVSALVRDDKSTQSAERNIPRPHRAPRRLHRPLLRIGWLAMETSRGIDQATQAGHAVYGHPDRRTRARQ